MRRDPRQLDLEDWIAGSIAAERPRWTYDSCVPAFKSLLGEFQETAVVGGRRAQEEVLMRINRFIHDVFDDTAGWNLYRPYRHNYYVREWMLGRLWYLSGPDERVILGQQFAWASA